MASRPFGHDVTATKDEGGWVCLWVRPNDARGLAHVLRDGYGKFGEDQAAALDEAARWLEPNG